MKKKEEEEEVLGKKVELLFSPLQTTKKIETRGQNVCENTSIQFTLKRLVKNTVRVCLCATFDDRYHYRAQYFYFANPNQLAHFNYPRDGRRQSAMSHFDTALSLSDWFEVLVGKLLVFPLLFLFASSTSSSTSLHQLKMEVCAVVQFSGFNHCHCWAADVVYCLVSFRKTFFLKEETLKKKLTRKKVRWLGKGAGFFATRLRLLLLRLASLK